MLEGERDRRRIEVPELDSQINADNVSECFNLVSAGGKSPDETIKEYYGVTTIKQGYDLLMQDIVISTMGDYKNLPNLKQTKTMIVDQFCQITGLSRKQAQRYFTGCQSAIKRISNLGMVTHFASSVAQDVVSRVYRDLDRLDKQENDLYTEIDDLDPNTENGSKAIKFLNSKINKIYSLKEKCYDKLLEFSKTFGVDLSIKNHQNVINEEKNVILEKKFANDASYQNMDIAIRYKDLSPDEKRKLLVQTIAANKGMTNLVLESTDNFTSDEQ